MRVAKEVQVFVTGLDAVADPAAAVILVVARPARGRAFVHDPRECAVAGHFESAAFQRAGEGGGYPQPVQRQDRAQARFDPENFRIIARIRHRKDSAAVGEHEKFGLDERV
ncbi:hypothetical protein A8V01_08195 [Novosphingobium guangzhouense]|uniref:Uncharacterized protein n=1 Tax=Novosphingobium guangzhouense TaxID=1850347 RepID=A0A2K2FW64_9SPHN|nr:hypothetical protein A8V01_08195 [Novosphingobium guangzhouense]